MRHRDPAQHLAPGRARGGAITRRLVIAGGGTGGHFYPALVLAQTLRGRGWRPLMLVRRGDRCLPVLETEGLPAVEVDVEGMPRGLSAAWLRFGWKLAGGLRLVGRVLADFQPDAVVGMGGYLTFPAIHAAFRARVPRAVHESNAVLGLANKFSVMLGAKLLQGLPGALGGTLTGTPIRPALWACATVGPARAKLGLDKSRATVLVFGGSQGAAALNTLVPKALAEASRKAPRRRLQILHLAGPKDVAAVQAAYGPLSAVVLPYLESMELAYAAADLVISRSGAGTTAELAAQRKPAVLVPYPFATAAHQEKNALILQGAGAGVLLREREIPARLPGLVQDLLLSEEGERRRNPMSQAYARLALPSPRDTAEKLADAIEEIAGHPRRQR